jgi:hypothetical protein
VVCLRGECVDGTCLCPSGYEGESCEHEANLKFAGSFTTDETCTAGDDSYTLNFFAEEGNPSGLRINGLWDRRNDTLAATVQDNGIGFNIARQSYAGYEIEGEGSLTASLVAGNISYRVYAVGATSAFDECTLSFQ